MRSHLAFDSDSFKHISSSSSSLLLLPRDFKPRLCTFAVDPRLPRLGRASSREDWTCTLTPGVARDGEISVGGARRWEGGAGLGGDGGEVRGNGRRKFPSHEFGRGTLIGIVFSKINIFILFLLIRYSSITEEKL